MIKDWQGESEQTIVLFLLNSMVVLFSRDQYEIIGLLKISHSTK